MEKLRTALEKRAVDFPTGKAERGGGCQRGTRVFVDAPECSVLTIVTICSPSRAEMARLFSGGVKHTQYLHNVAAHAVGNDVWSTGHDQLPDSGYSSRSASSGKSLQTLDRPCKRRHGLGRSVGIVLRDVLGHGDQVRARRAQPITVHDASNP